MALKGRNTEPQIEHFPGGVYIFHPGYPERPNYKEKKRL